jgi:SnoaL-like polyketide cyclase.
MEGTAMSNAANAALAEPWKDLWNGDLSLTDKIIAEDFVAHAAPLTGTEATRSAAARPSTGGSAASTPSWPTWPSPSRSARSPMRSTWSCGGRHAEPTAAAFPGASPEAAGREVTFTGTDTLRIADGMLAEYWANADSLLFFQQLGIREIPPKGDPPPGIRHPVVRPRSRRGIRRLGPTRIP